MLARPDLVNVINTPHYVFTGGDGLGHTLNNHDLFLDLYPGANGLKTGTTELAGHTFVGSATRGGRTMLAIVFDAADYYGSAASLLDQGFNTPVAAEANLDHLPPVVADASLPPPPVVRVDGPGGVPAVPKPAVAATAAREGGSSFNSPVGGGASSSSSVSPDSSCSDDARSFAVDVPEPRRGVAPNGSNWSQTASQTRWESPPASRRSSAGSCLSMWPISPL